MSLRLRGVLLERPGAPLGPGAPPGLPQPPRGLLGILDGVAPQQHRDLRRQPLSC